MDFPFRRILNLSRAIISEAVAFDEEARDAFHEAMEWPVDDDTTVSRDLSKQNQSARHAAQLIGSENVDAMVMRAFEARQRQLAGQTPEPGGDAP